MARATALIKTTRNLFAAAKHNFLSRITNIFIITINDGFGYVQVRAFNLTEVDELLLHTHTHTQTRAELNNEAK